MISLHEGKGSRVRKPVDRVLSLHLQIVGCRPPVWRRLLVKESMWLSRLHDSVQLLFDWFDYQTHTFSFGELRFGNPLKQEGRMVEDDRDVTLAELDLEQHPRFTYVYNFDEGWRVEIAVEKPPAPKKGARYPRIAAGERAGPPEDCGGPEAYHDMLASLKEPETDLGREWREWVGTDYDPEACDLEKLNQALRKLGK
jgi:Plasmid pRiA4b ORF-3-like protein